jgi:hypothetical protein
MKTIDLTPTWRGVIPILIAVLESGTEAGQQSAREELHRMASILDGVVTDERVMKTIRALSSAVDDRAQGRLDLIQRLAAWDSEKADGLDSLIAEATGLMQASSGSS